jgi:hypothetical protein
MQSKTLRTFRYLKILKKDRETLYLVREFVRCGKPICRCNQGLRHGPYWYLRYEEWDADARMDRYRREYVPKRELARVRRWIRRHRADAAFGRGVMGLLRRYVAGVVAKERRHRVRYVHESAWAPAWHQQIAVVRELLTAWRETASDAILEILQPGGPRLFPGNEPRAIGFAIQEFVANPLLHEIADRLGALPEPPAAPAPRAPRAATAIQDAKRHLVAARTAELGLRVAVTADLAYRPRRVVQAARAGAIAAAREEILTGLPGMCVRLTGGGPLLRPALTRAVGLCVDNVMAALAQPLARPQAPR